VLAARIALTFLTLLLFVGITPLAYADPPDCTWMSGYWDDDDCDEAVDFIMAASAIDVPAVELLSLFVLVARLEPVRPDGLPDAFRCAVSARAPPAPVSL